MIQNIILTLLVLAPYRNSCAEVIEQSVTDRLGKSEHLIDCSGGILLSPNICIPYGYRKGELPKIPLEIRTAIEISMIREIDDKKMTVSLEFHPKILWADNRIIKNFTEQEKRSGKVLNNVNLENIWKPDLLIENLCTFKLHSILEDISGLSISDGLSMGLENETLVYYQFSAKASVYCKFDFSRYPMDEQECNFTIGTTYPASHIVFTFQSAVFSFGKDTQNTDTFNLILKNVNDLMDNNSKFGFAIKMSRRLQPFIMECYFPVIAIVIVSHISFTIPLDSIPGRVALLVTQFLTLTNICIYQQVSRIISRLMDLNLTTI